MAGFVAYRYLFSGGEGAGFLAERRRKDKKISSGTGDFCLIILWACCLVGMTQFMRRHRIPHGMCAQRALVNIHSMDCNFRTVHFRSPQSHQNNRYCFFGNWRLYETSIRRCFQTMVFLLKWNFNTSPRQSSVILTNRPRETCLPSAKDKSRRVF